MYLVSATQQTIEQNENANTSSDNPQAAIPGSTELVAPNVQQMGYEQDVTMHQGNNPYNHNLFGATAFGYPNGNYHEIFVDQTQQDSYGCVDYGFPQPNNFPDTSQDVTSMWQPSAPIIEAEGIQGFDQQQQTDDDAPQDNIAVHDRGSRAGESLATRRSRHNGRHDHA